MRNTRNVAPVHAMKAYGGVEVELYSLTSTLDGGEWLTSCYIQFTPKKEPLIPIQQEAVWSPELVRTLWRRDKFIIPWLSTP